MQVLASTSKNGPYTSSLSGLSASTPVYFEVTDVMAPVGATNSTAGAGTITSETAADGLNKMEYTMTATSGAPFVSAALATPSTAPAANVDFTQGTGHKAYSTLTATTLTDGLPAAAATPNTFDGAVSGGPADVAEYGQLTFNSNASISTAYAASGVIGFNNERQICCGHYDFFQFW